MGSSILLCLNKECVIGGQVDGHRSQFKATIEDSSSIDEDVIVSVMLPAQQGDANGTRSFTPVDEVYVVAVNPTKRYVTYACSLQNPIMV